MMKERLLARMEQQVVARIEVRLDSIQQEQLEIRREQAEMRHAVEQAESCIYGVSINYGSDSICKKGMRGVLVCCVPTWELVEV